MKNKMTVIALNMYFIFIAAGFVSSAEFAGSGTCAGCHEKEYGQWENSIHARALSKNFEMTWTKLGKKPDCLSCHTTGHEKGTMHYAFPGVTCESCHGAFREGHPDNSKATMSLPVDSKICSMCHKNTYMEWKLSAHGQKNLRCFDCHQVHAQGLRVKGGETLCGSCHPERLKSFAHATHREKGLTCETCHFPAVRTPEEAIEGTGASSHTLFVGAEVCSRCHEEMVHKSHKLVSLRGEVGILQEKLRIAKLEDISKLKETIQTLEWEKSKTVQKAFFAGVICFVAGAAAGMIALHYFSVKK